MTDTDPLKRLYRSLRDHVTQGVAGDVMQMPPSWGELLAAVREAAFPDGDEEPEPLEKNAAGWDDAYDMGYAKGEAEGYRKATLRRFGGDDTPEFVGRVLRAANTSPPAKVTITNSAATEPTAVHEAAFPDADGDPKPEPQPLTVSEPIAGLLRGIAEKLDAGAQVVFLRSTDDDVTVTSGKKAAARIQYAAGWDDGYAEGHAEGYRVATLRRFGGEA